jgi:colicin import membrane protein
MMVERSESSVVVSVNELLRLEQRRVEQEADARRARDAAERAARADVEARTRAAEQERQRAAESRERAEALAHREQEARLLAIQEVELAKARHEADAAARARELRATREHEERLVAAREGARSQRLARTAYGAFALLAATWAAGGWYTWRTAHQVTAERASYREASAEQGEAYERLQQAYSEQSSAIAGLRSRLADLSQRETLAPPPAASTPIAPTSHPRVTPDPPRPPAARRAPCRQGDPICSDLP